MVMREGAVSLGDVEAEDDEAGGAGELLMERTFLLVSDLVTTCIQDKMSVRNQSID